MALLAVVAAPTLAIGVGAADPSAAPAVVEQRGTVDGIASNDEAAQAIDEAVPSTDERERRGRISAVGSARNAAEIPGSDFGVPRVGLGDEAIPFTGEGIGLSDLLGVLLAGVLLNGLLDRVSSASWFDSGVKSRLSRSIAAVAPSRHSAERKRTEGADANDVRSDEEVVRHLLERHDGRMRQSKIVEETEWSKAKVSRLLGKMEDAGDIVKVPIGRQNLVYLDGMEPEITKPHGEVGG